MLERCGRPWVAAAPIAVNVIYNAAARVAAPVAAVAVGFAVCGAVSGAWAGQEGRNPGAGGGELAPASALARSLDDRDLSARVEEILERNPRLAALDARARAARLEAPRHGALPDPTLAATAFLAPPETRVGPQRLMLSLSQRWPAFGKLALRERAALLEASALAAESAATAVELVTEARRLWYELAFVHRQLAISDEFRGHLVQHEEIARTRYATGIGPGQGVIKLQAAITRVESQQIELERRRAVLEAEMSALADRPTRAVAPMPELPERREPRLEREALLAAAIEHRPELAAAEARRARARTLEQLAAREARPDLTFGLTYTVVEPRDDAAGRLQPPLGNGDDVFGVQGGVSLPLGRAKIRAGRDAARELARGADERSRAVRSRIRAQLDELASRIVLGWRQLELLDGVLTVQAEEALASARSGYVAGTLNALDLLDAEHVLFEAQTAVARAAADYAIDRARLEGTVAAPLGQLAEVDEPDKADEPDEPDQTEQMQPRDEVQP